MGSCLIMLDGVFPIATKSASTPTDCLIWTWLLVKTGKLVVIHSPLTLGTCHLRHPSQSDAPPPCSPSIHTHTHTHPHIHR